MYWRVLVNRSDGRGMVPANDVHYKSKDRAENEARRLLNGKTHAVRAFAVKVK